MRYWPTLVLALVLAGLGLYLYAIELPQKESHEQQDIADKKVLLFDQETLSGLTIKTDRYELVFARTPERGWVLTAPLNTEADQREVQNLIRALVTGTVTRAGASGSDAIRASLDGVKSHLMIHRAGGGGPFVPLPTATGTEWVPA